MRFKIIIIIIIKQVKAFPDGQVKKNMTDVVPNQFQDFFDKRSVEIDSIQSVL